MSLFRTANVVSLGVALMPSDKAQQERLYAQTASAATWTLTFCDRNADTCKKAGDAWGVFLAKAEFAAKMAYELAQQSPATTPNGAANAAFAPHAPGAPAHQGTLTPDDLKPSWRGQVARRGV